MRMIPIILAALLIIGAATPVSARWQCISEMHLSEGDPACEEYYSDLRMYYGYVLTQKALNEEVSRAVRIVMVIAALRAQLDDLHTRQLLADPSVAPDLVP